MGWKACVGCCGAGDKTEDDQENIIAQEEAEEVDEQYVFLEQFPTDRRVENPNVPFVGELPVPMDVGRVVELDGKVLPDATRFSLNLACGEKPSADLALHFNPRFDQNYVARNSRLSGRWGYEETLSSQRNPFKRNQKFHIIILSAEDEFMVAVNGIHFCSYTYRTVPIKIQSIQINGDVTVNTLQYHMTEKYPEIPPFVISPFMDITPQAPLSDSITDAVELPLLARLPLGIHIGQMLEIVGRTKLLPHSFYVNLQNDLFMWPHPEVLLHVNPRFKTAAFVMNSWTKGGWGTEIACPLLFKPGRPFALQIVLSSDEFKVSIDGCRIGSFHYRSAPHVIKALYIQGDVLIKEITINPYEKIRER